MQQAVVAPEKKVKKILLVGIYDTNTVSLAPQILKAYAEQFDVSQGFEIATKEFSIFNDSIESIVEGINKENPDIVGFSAYIWNINEISEIIKKIDALVMLGGPQVTGIEKELMEQNPDIDIIVTGEGEMVFKELLEYFSGQKKIEDIKGVTTKSISNPPSHEFVDLDTIPLIYEDIFRKNPDITWISFETSRGCPMGCKYCTWGYSRTMRYFSLEKVKKELDAILKQDKIQNIYLCDSNLLLDRARAKKIFQYIIDSGAKKTIRYEFKAEQFDDEIIELLSQLPNNEFNFGIQSTNKQALKEIGRVFNKEIFEEKYKKIIERFQDSPITVDLIYGLPGDNIEGYKESLDYAASLDKLKRVLTNPLIILPGSEFYRLMDKYGVKLRDKKSYMVKENATFSEKDMELARKYSFFVAVVFLNYHLRDCLKLLAKDRNIRYIDAIINFMESLPVEFAGESYPDMIPSVKEDFKQRNAIFKKVINKYDDIINNFKEFSLHKYDDMMAGYEDNYSEQFSKLKRFAESD
jgi:radical SAM superfamily enzyme YgiQ (UPF0313 family)